MRNSTIGEHSFDFMLCQCQKCPNHCGKGSQLLQKEQDWNMFNFRIRTHHPKHDPDPGE